MFMIQHLQQCIFFSKTKSIFKDCYLYFYQLKIVFNKFMTTTIVCDRLLGGEVLPTSTFSMAGPK